jgi:hypothetical protein
MKLNQTIATVTTAIAMALAGNAFAQDATPRQAAPPPAPEVAPPPAPEVAPAPEVEPAPEVAPPPMAVPQPMGAPFNTADTGAAVAPPNHWEPASRSGMAIMGGGGVTDFTQNTARDTTSTGGSWDVRLVFGTRRWLGFEGSYVGGANSLHNLGTNNSSTLVRNGVEGSLRLNLPLYVHDTLFEPYAAGGVGWNGYRVTNYNAALSSSAISANSDNTVSVPLAVGFALGYKGFIADTRFTLRPTYNQTLLTQETSGALTNWDFGGMIGYEF